MLGVYFLIIFMLFSPVEHVLIFCVLKVYCLCILKECTLSVHKEILILAFSLVNNN